MNPSTSPKIPVDQHPITNDDLATADTALDYIRSTLADKERNDYEHNLYVVCSLAGVSYKMAGIAASAISFYLRAVAKAAEDAAPKVVSQHFGTVKDRVVLKVKVVKIITVSENGMYGPSYLHHLITGEGNAVVWFSSDAGNNLVPGKDVWVKATVTKHDVFRDVKQTTGWSKSPKKKLLSLQRKPERRRDNNMLLADKITTIGCFSILGEKVCLIKYLNKVLDPRSENR